MPSVIDSLVVQLSLDARQLNEQTRQALDDFKRTSDQAKKYATETESHGKKVLEFFGELKRTALGITALFLGGMGVEEFVGHMTNLEAATGRIAKTMDLSAAELSIWQGAAERLGGSAEGITGTLQGLSTELNKFAVTGQTALLGPLNQLGIQIHNANGSLKTSTQLFMDITKAVQGIDPARAHFLLSLLGFDQGAINMAIVGQTQLKNTLNETMQALHGGFSPDDVRRAQEYQAALAGVEQSASTLGKTLLTIASPYLTSTFDAISRVLQAMGSGKKPSGEPLATGTTKTLPGAGSGYYLGGLYGAMGGGSDNWGNFLSGLSYLETSQHGGGNATSSAQGFFQFLTGTASQAKDAGLPDPRQGSYGDQATATKQFIQKFHPEAAAAIDRGDFTTAAKLLNQIWPSLPGGSQPQSAQRYQTWGEELSGGGPRPPIGAPASAAISHTSSLDNRRTNSTMDKSTKIDIGEVNIHAPNADPERMARDIPEVLRRQASLGSWNSGLA